MQNERWKILDWLCIDTQFLKSRSVGGFVSFLTIIAFLLFVPATLFQFAIALLGLEEFNSATERYEAIRNMGLVVAALVGVPFLAWRSIVAQKQVDVAEQGNITDRINKAIEGLGAEKTIKRIDETPRYKKANGQWLRDEKGDPVPAKRPDGKEIIDRESLERSEPNLEVRIGSIYALERISKDSPRDHIQIMEILCAYVRENVPSTSLEPTEKLLKRRQLRTDIQTAITVFGRRPAKQLELENAQEFRLNLSNTDLSGADFRGGNFAAVQFHNCRIEAGNFSKSELTGTQFFGALLNHSIFDDANLFGTRFDGAIINRPEIQQGAMSYSITMANIFGISIASADMSAINYLGEPPQQNLIFGSGDTRLHRQLEFPRDTYAKNLHRLQKLEEAGDIEKAIELKSQLYSNGFVDWFPYDRNDLTFSHYYRKFLERLEIDYWPITD